MNKIILSAIAAIGVTAVLKTKSEPALKITGEPDDQPGIKPVENEEVFDHLFLDKYIGFTILNKTAA